MPAPSCDSRPAFRQIITQIQNLQQSLNAEVQRLDANDLEKEQVYRQWVNHANLLKREKDDLAEKWDEAEDYIAELEDERTTRAAEQAKETNANGVRIWLLEKGQKVSEARLQEKVRARDQEIVKLEQEIKKAVKEGGRLREEESKEREKRRRLGQAFLSAQKKEKEANENLNAKTAENSRLWDTIKSTEVSPQSTRNHLEARVKKYTSMSDELKRQVKALKQESKAKDANIRRLQQNLARLRGGPEQPGSDALPECDGVEVHCHVGAGTGTDDAPPPYQLRSSGVESRRRSLEQTQGRNDATASGAEDEGHGATKKLRRSTRRAVQPVQEVE